MLFAEGATNRPAMRLRHADQHAAEQRAGHRAQAADDDDDEGEQGIGRPERRRDVDQQHHGAARDRDAHRAEAEGEGVELLHVEADDQGAEVVVGAGPDGFSGQRVI